MYSGPATPQGTVLSKRLKLSLFSGRGRLRFGGREKQEFRVARARPGDLLGKGVVGGLCLPPVPPAPSLDRWRKGPRLLGDC